MDEHFESQERVQKEETKIHSLSVSETKSSVWTDMPLRLETYPEMLQSNFVLFSLLLVSVYLRLFSKVAVFAAWVWTSYTVDTMSRDIWDFTNQFYRSTHQKFILILLYFICFLFWCRTSKSSDSLNAVSADMHVASAVEKLESLNCISGWHFRLRKRTFVKK
jgi:hypothetical protein